MPRVLTETDIAGFRERLCELATRLFVERGPEHFNMRMLATEMGVSAMTPYRYFRDKNEILSLIRARAFTRLATQLERALASPGTPQERSAEVGRAYIRFALDEQTCFRLVFDFIETDSTPESKEAEARARAAMTDHIRLLVDHGDYEGDPELIGHVFWAGLHGLVVLQQSGKLNGDFDKVHAEMCRVLRGAYRIKTPA